MINVSSVEEYHKHRLFNKQKRAGAVPYTIIKNKIYICLGRDRKTSDLTDFAGMKNKGESVIDAALREFAEESRGVFGQILADKINGCKCIYDEQKWLLLVPVISYNSDIIEVTRNNFSRYSFIDPDNRRDRIYNEVKSLVWLNEKKIYDVLICKNRLRNYNVYTKTLSMFNCYLAYSLGILKYALGIDKKKIFNDYKPKNERQSLLHYRHRFKQRGYYDHKEEIGRKSFALFRN